MRNGSFAGIEITIFLPRRCSVILLLQVKYWHWLWESIGWTWKESTICNQGVIDGWCVGSDFHLLDSEAYLINWHLLQPMAQFNVHAIPLSTFSIPGTPKQEPQPPQEPPRAPVNEFHITRGRIDGPLSIPCLSDVIPLAVGEIHTRCGNFSSSLAWHVDKHHTLQSNRIIHQIYPRKLFPFGYLYIWKIEEVSVLLIFELQIIIWSGMNLR